MFGHVDESPWLRFEFIPIFLEMQRYLMNRKSETNAATSPIWSSQLLRLFSGTSLAYYTLLSCELHTYLQCCSCWMKVGVKDPTMKRFFGRRMQQTCCHVFVCWRRRNKHWQGGKKCIPTIPWKNVVPRKCCVQVTSCLEDRVFRWIRRNIQCSCKTKILCARAQYILYWSSAFLSFLLCDHFALFFDEVEVTE